MLPREGHTLVWGLIREAQKGLQRAGIFVAPFSKVDRTVLLAADVGVTPKRETFLLLFRVQSTALLCFRAQESEVTITTLSNVAANSQRTSSENRKFRLETGEIVTQESTRNLDLRARLLLWRLLLWFSQWHLMYSDKLETKAQYLSHEWLIQGLGRHVSTWDPLVSLRVHRGTLEVEPSRVQLLMSTGSWMGFSRLKFGT